VTPEAKSANYDYTGYSPATEPFAAPFNGCPNAPLKPAATDADSGAAELQPLDEFSEQHMYWHVADGYAFFRGLFTDNGRADFKLRAQPLAIAVNLCTVDFSAGITGNLAGPLIPFDNAFFSPGANNIVAETLIMGQDSIMFGQGTKYDFAYDGDVIKHEFTHAVIDTLGKLTLQGAEDVWGLQDDQGAMNEGLADYFSSVQAGNPTLGEYAGRDIPGGSGNEGAIRDLTNTDECGRDRWGEVHQDSQAFSASLWGGRVAIAGDPSSAGFDAAKGRLFDRAVLAAVAAFGGNVDMTTAATNVAAEVSMLLDGPSAQKLQDSFTTHKILPQCDRVIDYAGAGKKALLGLDGTDSPYAPSGAKRVPGFVQWQLDVPAGADSITAGTRLAAQAGSFSGSGSLLGGGAAPKLELIVGPAGMPIQWVVNTDAGNEAASAPFSGTTGTITATLGALVPGTYYVMIVNSGGGIIAQDVTLTTSCTNAAGCAPPDMAMPKTNSSGGCKCDVGGSGRAPLAPIVLMALVLAFRWRSSRRRWR
jgi:MYXO-CTERM domain-containing protein